MLGDLQCKSNRGFGLCWQRHWKTAGMSSLKWRWINHSWSGVTDYNELALFLMSFCLTYIKDTLVPTMNKSLPSKDKMSLREYIQWLGMTFFIACFEGVSDHKQWRPLLLQWLDVWQPVWADNASPLIHWPQSTQIPRQVFWNSSVAWVLEWLLCSLVLTHYFNTLDESMNICLNKYCPGWMCVPHKPHPFGSEYHTITDGDFGAAFIWCYKLHEGKNHPSQLEKKKLYEKGATVGSMLRMMEPIHQTNPIIWILTFEVKKLI